MQTDTLFINSSVRLVPFKATKIKCKNFTTIDIVEWIDKKAWALVSRSLTLFCFTYEVHHWHELIPFAEKFKAYNKTMVRFVITISDFFVVFLTET